MISFWIICALLIIIALIIILPSLLAKQPHADVDQEKINKAVYQKKCIELEQDRARDLIDAEQYEIAAADLQRTLLDDITEQNHSGVRSANRVLPVIIILLIPVVAIVLYLKIDNGLVSLNLDFQQEMQARQQGKMPPVEQAIAGLEQKLLQDPGNLKGWLMLGRSYLMIEKFDKAVHAYATANEISNGADPNVLVAYGEAQGFAAGNNFNQNSLTLFNKALQIDPLHQRGLWYAGLAAFQLQDYANARGYWQRLMEDIPDDQTQARTALRAYLNEARQKAGIEVAINDAPSDAVLALKHNDLAQASITVHVSIANKFKENFIGANTLFIYARAQDGPKMPLALVRMTAADLPVAVTLDDSVGMLPGMTLSSVEQVEIIARISKSGQAITQSGDLLGSIQSVATNKPTTVAVVISEIAP